MKKLALFLALAALSAGCAPAVTTSTTTTTTTTTVTASSTSTGASTAGTEPTANASRVLVVYFSLEGEQYRVGVIEKGNTEIVAEIIARETGADIFELVAESGRYPETYNALTDAAKKEQGDNARPAYTVPAPDLSDYDTVFIGAPVWWGDWPMIMYTFFESVDLSGKTLYPFSTHEGSGLSGFDTKLASACPRSTVGKGLAVRGSDAQNDAEGTQRSVLGWLSELGMK